jgi:hypothetical protein
VIAREISESRTRLGIVLLRDCSMPELLRVKHRIGVSIARLSVPKAAVETIPRGLPRNRPMTFLTTRPDAKFTIVRRKKFRSGAWNRCDRRKPLFYVGIEHVLCYAPTRSGKGVGLIVRLCFPGSKACL